MNEFQLKGPLHPLLFVMLATECLDKGLIFETDTGFDASTDVKDFVQTMVDKHDLFAAMYEAHQKLYNSGIDGDFCAFVLVEIASGRWGDPDVYMADLKL